MPRPATNIRKAVKQVQTALERLEDLLAAGASRARARGEPPLRQAPGQTHLWLNELLNDGSTRLPGDRFQIKDRSGESVLYRQTPNNHYYRCRKAVYESVSRILFDETEAKAALCKLSNLRPMDLAKHAINLPTDLTPAQIRAELGVALAFAKAVRRCNDQRFGQGRGLDSMHPWEVLRASSWLLHNHTQGWILEQI